MPSGSTDLARMLAELDASVREGVFVVAVVPPGDPVIALADAVVVEEEGVTVVLRRETADAHGLQHEFPAAWLTLTVHSSLEAIGLTAACSAALGRAGISCNVLAGAHHDHVLVPVHLRDAALEALRGLRG